MAAGFIRPARGPVYAVVRQGADDELFSSPAGRDAWARIGTMTGSNLAVSGKAAWFGTSTASASTYLWATADGVRWRKYPFSCLCVPRIPSMALTSRVAVPVA